MEKKKKGSVIVNEFSDVEQDRRRDGEREV